MDDGVVQQRVEVALLGLGDVIAIVENVPDDRDLRGIAAVVAAGDRAGGAQRRVHRPHVRVHKNIALDPGVSAIEIKYVISRADKNVVVELDDRLTQVAIASSIIHDVIRAGRCAEETLAHDTPASGFNAPCAM